MEQSTEMTIKGSFSEHFGRLRESPSAVHLKEAITTYKPYVFPACSFYGINRPKGPHFP
jgi:hypothetical protein